MDDDSFEVVIIGGFSIGALTPRVRTGNSVTLVTDERGDNTGGVRFPLP